MLQEIIVDMGRIVVVEEPAILTGLGLGSCIGLMIYDVNSKVAGFGHIMLPDSSKAHFVEQTPSSIVAETEDDVIRAIKDAMSANGFDLKAVARTSDEALKLYREVNPHLFMAGDMLSGSMIKDMLDYNHSANIVITEGSSTDCLEFLRIGAMDVVRRPITKPKLDIVLDLAKNARYLRFADIAIAKMIRKMLSLGCRKENLRAKMAGGAHMFSHSQVEMRNIGMENATSVSAILNTLGIPLVAKDVGGTFGRTVRFHADSFTAVINSKDAEKTI